jgi:hypothetical protein
MCLVRRGLERVADFRKLEATNTWRKLLRRSAAVSSEAGKPLSSAGLNGTIKKMNAADEPNLR